MSKFKVGDRVRVILRDSCFYGQETTVVATGVLGFCYYSGTFSGYETEIPHHTWAGGIEHCHAVFKAESIELIYDGHEKTSWSECVWQPKSLTVC